VILVVVVVLLFLQRWRAAIIPIIAIPVSLVGTFGVMAALGFSINNLTLFGLVLAVGIVVDDAIVVVENVERHLANGLAPREAAMRTMGEVGGALISIALVLCAVFIPTAFLTGITGQFYRQFAVTIAVATAISAFNSLTLSPALASMLLQPHGTHGAGRRSLPGRMVQRSFDAFNRAFDRSAALYGGVVRAISSIRVIMLGAFALLIGLTVWTLVSTPQGFIPQQDRGYLIVSVQLPGGASLARTTAVLKRVEEVVLATPGVVRAAVFGGFSGATRTISSSAGALFPAFAPYEERLQQGLTAQAIAGELRKRLGEIDEAFIVDPPPPVPASAPAAASRCACRTWTGAEPRPSRPPPRAWWTLRAPTERSPPCSARSRWTSRSSSWRSTARAPRCSTSP
jgi:multidrug efflux pump subunit AcrB